MTQLAFQIVYLSVFSSLIGCTTFSHPDSAELVACQNSKQCIVVQHDHCCGSTKKAINKKFKDYYLSMPRLHKTADPETCAMVGMCRDDSAVEEAACKQNTCQLVWPK